MSWHSLRLTELVYYNTRNHAITVSRRGKRPQLQTIRRAWGIGNGRWQGNRIEVGLLGFVRRSRRVVGWGGWWLVSFGYGFIHHSFHSFHSFHSRAHQTRVTSQTSRGSSIEWSKYKQDRRRRTGFLWQALNAVLLQRPVVYLYL